MRHRKAGASFREYTKKAEYWKNMLELKNISFMVDSEGADKEIIRDVTLTIPDRKMVVVTGPNGGGKSTLARLIAGIEKPTSGQIFLNGEDIQGDPRN